MIVGVPKEVKDDEYRVAITPAGVRELTSAGHSVVVEEGAGAGSSIPDQDFRTTGAILVSEPDEIWAESDLILGVKEPVVEEYPRLGLRRNQVLFTYLHLAASSACTEALMAAGNTAIAYETVRLPDNSLPLLTPMSEVAGRMAPLMGSHHLMRPGGGRGVLVCGVPGVRCAKVVILGAGVAGMAAATLAVGMHSEVYILDRNLERLRQVDHHFRGGLETVASSTHAIEETCADADIVIGAVLVVGAKAPKLVSDELVARMREGSVLVDISVDQGGCFESTRPTTHSDPTFEVNGSIFYCVANMPGAVPHSSTHALVNATLPVRVGHRQQRMEGRRPGRRRPGRGCQRGGGIGGLRAGGRGPRIGRGTARILPGLNGRYRMSHARQSLPVEGTPGESAGGGAPLQQVVRHRDAGTQGRIGHRIEPDRPQRYLARPHVECTVGPVTVVGWAFADLHRRLVEGQPQHRGGGQLPGRGGAGVLPLPRGHVIADDPQSRRLLVVGQHLGEAVDHGTAVVHRVVEDRAGQHHPVDERHGRAHRDRLLGGAQAAAGHRAVQVEMVTGPPVARGHHHRATGHLQTQVADESGVEHGVEVLSPVRALGRQPSQSGPLGGRAPGGARVLGRAPTEWTGIGHGAILTRRATI